MILVDFDKAFDALSWKYISKILESFNFSEKTIAIIKSLQKNQNPKFYKTVTYQKPLTLEGGVDRGTQYSPIPSF